MTIKILSEEEKKEFVKIIKENDLTSKEVATMLDVTLTHFSTALPILPRSRKTQRPNVPAKWFTDFKNLLELEKLRKLQETIKNIQND